MTAGANPVPNLIGLLYVGDAGERHANLSRRAPDPLEVYLRDAATFARSAREARMEYTLVTNDAARLERLATQIGLGMELPIVERSFALQVPPGISFRSAHFKLDMISELGSGRFGEHVALVDLDAVVLRTLSLPDASSMWAYDVSSQWWPDGLTPDICGSIASVAGETIEGPRWYGGEFLAGPAHLFAQLADAVDLMWPRYLANIDSVHHVSDEMVLSSALNWLAGRDFPVRDAGAARLVQRWTSKRHPLPLDTFDSSLDCAVLHLVADKVQLARSSDRPFTVAGFLDDYRSHVRRRLPLEYLKAAVDRTVRFRRSYPPALS